MEQMDCYGIHKELLLHKFAEIHKRTAAACKQLDDRALNWRPTEESNSIANLILHMGANIRERIGWGMLGLPYERDREAEFDQLPHQSADALSSEWDDRLSLLIDTLREATPELLSRTQQIRGQERSNLAIFHQCAAHFSEHMGQILYIAKMSRGGQYVSTSIPRKGTSR